MTTEQKLTPIPWPGDDHGPERCLAFVVWRSLVGEGDWVSIERRRPDEGPDYYVFASDGPIVGDYIDHITHYLLLGDPRNAIK